MDKVNGEGSGIECGRLEVDRAGESNGEGIGKIVIEKHKNNSNNFNM